jgi:outer membrane immunogenic protein
VALKEHQLAACLIRADAMLSGGTMKKLFLSTVALLGLAGVASAADLPARSAPVAYAPAFTWTGFYFGAHGGYMWSDTDVRLAHVDGFFLPTDIDNGVFPRSIEVDRDAGFGGVQAGYNLQSGMYVFGIEADIAWFGSQDGTRLNVIDPAPLPSPFAGALVTTTYRSDLETLGTVRARAGVAFDRTLLFVTAGLAGGEVENSFGIAIPRIAYNTTWSSRDTEWGWAVGGGIEYALTDNIMLKADYLYYDLGDRTIRARDDVTPGFAGEIIDYKFKNSGNLVRGGVNFRF